MIRSTRQGGEFPLETELLLLVARAELNAAQRAHLSTLLQRNLDWDALLALARWNGVLPLLAAHLSTEHLPLSARAALMGEAHDVARRNLFLTAELLKLRELFATQEIDFIAFKGPILANALYDNLALRLFRDLDLLVHRRDIPRIQALLRANGYSAQYRLTPRQEAAFIQLECHLPFLCNHNSSIVELHWELAPKDFALHLDSAKLWMRGKNF
jgi:hypothetical protein